MANKSDFFKQIKTQEDGRTIGVSFSDELEKLSPQQIDPPARENLLIQVGKEGEYACAYLGRTQVDSLILSLQQARAMWFAKF